MWSTTLLQLLVIAATVYMSNETGSGVTVTESLTLPQPSSPAAMTLPELTATVLGQLSSSTPTPAPSTPTPAPSTPTPAPSTTTPAPSTPTPAPSTPTPAPSTPTPAPSTPTPAPSTTTPAPSTGHFPQTSTGATTITSSSNLLAPSSSTSNLPAPSSSTSNLPAPSSSTSNLPAPSSSTSNLPAPSSSTSNLPAPSSSTSNLPAPSSSTSNLPAPSSSTSNLPAPSSSTSNLPAPSSSTSNLPAPLSSTSDLPRISTSLVKPTPSNSPSSYPTVTESPPTSIFDVLRMNVGVVVVVVVGLALILLLLGILCCVCCYGLRRSHSKKKLNLNLASSELTYENQGTAESYTPPNIVAGTSYRSNNSNTALNFHHHYEPTLNSHPDRERSSFYKVESSQALGSQPLHSQNSVAHSDIFQQNTLPELSPMCSSLTATYPFHSDTNNASYLNTMPTSNVSLRQPTMFAISLQNEESKSAQSSRLSISGSKTPSIHSSRPSVYGSRLSALYGSRPLVSNLGTSHESLIGVRAGRKLSLEEEGESGMRAGHIFSSPSLHPRSSPDDMDTPTRDSPGPLVSASSMPLTHSKRDFASLTCILDYKRRGSISSPSPSPLESAQRLEQEGFSPMHQDLRLRRDLASLTNLDVLDGGGVANRGEENGRTIPKEEGTHENSKVTLEKVKEDISVGKKPRSKALSRLEKLTSLNYIRQSFRMKKKVSFEPSPEHKPTSLSPAKKATHKGTVAHDMILTNELAHNHPDGGGRPERGAKSDWRHGRQASSTPTEMLSPTQNIPHGMYLQQQLPEQPGGAGYYAAQLSQSSYYLPPHVGGVGPGPPLVYPYPQLSQQYCPSLSQNYPHHAPPYHTPAGESFAHGFPRDGQGDVRSSDPRYHEVFTPDYSDTTTSEHEHFMGIGGARGRRVGSDDNYDSRRSSYGGRESPEKFLETTTTCNLPKKHPLNMTDRSGAHSNGFTKNHCFRDELSLMESPQRHGIGYVEDGRGGGPEHLHEERGGEGRYSYHQLPMKHIPEDVFLNSIDVDHPTHQKDGLLQNQTNTSMELGRSNYSSARVEVGEPGAGKGHVSWNSMLTTYPPEDYSSEHEELTKL